MAWLRQMMMGGIGIVVVAVMLAPAAYAGDQDERDLHANRRERLMQQRPLHRPRDAQPAQRLSPEERRQLRRDIKDAGREIYPPPR